MGNQQSYGEQIIDAWWPIICTTCMLWNSLLAVAIGPIGVPPTESIWFLRMIRTTTVQKHENSEGTVLSGAVSSQAIISFLND
jgi:hypothetical protein